MKNRLLTAFFILGAFTFVQTDLSFAKESSDAEETIESKAKVGEAAPEFEVKDSNDKEVSLSKYQGKFVVLEWYNKDCPYIKKHYETKNMQKLQKEWTKKGVIWLTIQSSAEGKEGHQTSAQANKTMKKVGAAATATILDPSGKLGRLYGAKTTPHMFVIDPTGKLIYDGAIDDHASTDHEDVKGAKNYVSQALTEAMDGKPVSVPTTAPYGCGVKYK